MNDERARGRGLGEAVGRCEGGRVMDYDERIRTLEEQVVALSGRVRRVAEGLRNATRIIVTLKGVLIDEGVLTAEQFDAKLRELGVAIDEIRRLEDMFGQEGA